MNYKLRIMRRKIENLRNDMILTFFQEGNGLGNPKVLRLSQLLDEQLNRYDQYVSYHSLWKHIRVAPMPLFGLIRRKHEAVKSCRLPVS